MSAEPGSPARARVLARLRRRLGGSGDDEAARAAATAERLRRAGEAPEVVPAQARAEGAARIALFAGKLAAVDAGLTRLPAWSALPEALARELRARNLPRALRMGDEPDFAALDWGGTEISRGPGRPVEPAALSRAFAGVAETGTLALRSGPDNPVTLTFLAETHFVALREAELAAGLEEIWARLRAEGGPTASRTVNFVTGPSRSADIGQKLQLGAHGPVALHVFLVAE